MAERTSLRRRLAVLTATVGVVAAGFGLLPQASATQDAKSQRFFGTDRYGTAVDVSKHAYTAATDAVIASGEAFPDALSASYLAGQVAGPVLLVKRDELPSITSTELTRLGVKTVWLVGGTNAISSAVESQLASKYTVKRVAGADRYETAKAVVTQTGFTVGTYKNDKTAIVASGENYPDALAGGGVAYGKKFPLLLTASQSLSTPASDALTSLQIKRVILLGGTTAVSPTVQAAIAAKQISVERVGGANRAATAAQLGELALSGLGFKNTEVVVASGSGFADALAGATYAGKNLVPTLLMGSVPPETQAFVKGHNSTLVLITALGGTTAISDSDLNALTTTAVCKPAPTTTTTSAPGFTLLPAQTTTSTSTTTTTVLGATTTSTTPTCTTTTTGPSTTAPSTTSTTAAGGSTTTTTSSNPLCPPLCAP